MNKELVDYVKQQMNINVSRNKTTDVLLKQGWHQSEIDEAFLVAEGKAVGTQDAPRDAFEDSQADDFGESEKSFGSGLTRKAIFIIAAVLALAAVIAGIFIFSSGSKKNNSGKETAAIESVADTAAVANNTDAGAAVAENKQTQVNDAVLAAIKELRASIQAPAGWTAREGTIRSRPLVAFFKPELEKDGSGKEVFNENISVTRESIAAVNVADAAGYIAKSKTALQSSVATYKIVSERKAKLADGTDVTLINGTFTQNGIDLKNTQMFAFSGDNVYVVTGVALALNWDKEKDMIGTAIMSFKMPNAQ